MIVHEKLTFFVDINEKLIYFNYMINYTFIMFIVILFQTSKSTRKVDFHIDVHEKLIYNKVVSTKS